VEHDGNPEGHQNVLLPSKAKTLQTTGVKMEQRSFREYLPGKKTAGTKTRGPSGANHSYRAHNNSTTGGSEY
jgi:hypothetical protein